ncbi:MAG: hypothetical protein N2234_02510 [Planctomycetota bacterium]|nr:hypothetical protein [Planctomycetota bacterium]
MPFTDHIGLTSEHERKKARKTRFFIRWVLLLCVFAVLFGFSILITKIIRQESPNIPVPFLASLSLSVAEFISTYWYICLGALILLGIILEMVAEAKWKLTLFYFFLLLTLGILCCLAYKHSDNFWESVKQKVSQPLEGK